MPPMYSEIGDGLLLGLPQSKKKHAYLAWPVEIARGYWKSDAREA